LVFRGFHEFINVLLYLCKSYGISVRRERIDV